MDAFPCGEDVGFVRGLGGGDGAGGALAGIGDAGVGRVTRVCGWDLLEMRIVQVEI